MITLPTRTIFPAADNQVIPPPIILIQGESQGREISITMMDGDGTPIDLTAAAAVALYYTKPDGTKEQLPCTVEDAAGGTVSVAFTSSSCAVAGDMRQAILRITWSDASNSRYVGPRIHVVPSPSDDAAESSNEFALLDQLISQAQEAIGDAGEATSAANTATEAANAAKDAANTAAGAANTAAEAANAAKDAANTAAGAANTATGEANTAAGAANTAADRANSAAESAEGVLAGAVASVNGKRGDVTLVAEDVGALPISGGTMTGPLNATDFTICDGTIYPSVDYKADFSGTVRAQVLANTERNIIYFRNWCLDDTGHYENFLLPDPDTGLAKNENYLVLTTKNASDYVVAQGSSGGWPYRKWENGWAECWHATKVTPKTFTANGTLYYTDIITIPYPFNFTSAPVAFVSTYNSNVIGATMNGNDLGSISLRMITTTNTASDYADRTIKIYVSGRWK